MLLCQTDAVYQLAIAVYVDLLNVDINYTPTYIAGSMKVSKNFVAIKLDMCQCSTL